MIARLALVVAIAVGCGSPNKPPPGPIGNTTEPAVVPAARPGLVSGTLHDEHGEALMGATVVLTGAALVGEQVLITDDAGRYHFDTSLDPGPYEITIYYQDFSVRRAFTVDGPTTVDQVVRVAGGSGEMIVCTDATLASCH